MLGYSVGYLLAAGFAVVMVGAFLLGQRADVNRQRWRGAAGALGLIVNDTNTTIRIETAAYSSSSYGFGGDSVQLDVGEAHAVETIDHLGPADPVAELDQLDGDTRLADLGDLVAPTVASEPVRLRDNEALEEVGLLIPYMTIYVIAALLGVVGVGCGLAQNKFPDRRKVLKAGQVVAFLGAVAVLGYAFIIGQTVIVFEGKAPAITYSKFIMLGETELANTKEHQTISNAGHGAWIVNETPNTLHVTTAHYGSSSLSVFGGGDDHAEVLAGTAQHIPETVDNFGPDDPLPQSVSSKSSFESRTQVSW